MGQQNVCTAVSFGLFKIFFFQSPYSGNIETLFHEFIYSDQEKNLRLQKQIGNFALIHRKKYLSLKNQLFKSLIGKDATMATLLRTYMDSNTNIQ